MQYVAMMVGVWGAWVVVRVIAAEREIRMRMLQDSMDSHGDSLSDPAPAK